MKKNKGVQRNALSQDEDAMLAEYDFSEGVRGATVARYREGTNMVRLDPDVATLFPTSEDVNVALRVLARATRKTRARSRRSRSV